MCFRILLVVGIFIPVNVANAAYLIEIDTDGMDDGVITLNDDFFYDFDSGTSDASQSSPSRAFGLTGGDSIFGGNGMPDTYSYFYDPESQEDNLEIPADQRLGNEETASGLVGGEPGTYRVYATWPFTANVGGGLTEFLILSGDEELTVEIDQNGKGHEWVPLGDIAYSEDPIEVYQIASEESFVSMRSSGVLFELQPEFVEPEPVVCLPNSGDFDGNGQVEFADFLILSTNFGMPGGPSEGDADCNGQIEFADFLVLSTIFGNEVRAEPVPETSMSWPLLLGLALFCRSRSADDGR